MSIRVTRQITVHVVREGRSSVALWAEYEHAGAVRSQVIVLEPEETLIPRGRLAYGSRASAADVTHEQLVGWLERQGYRIISSATSPAEADSGPFRGSSGAP